MYFLGIAENFPQNVTEFIIGDLGIDTGARLGDGCIITHIKQNRWMQRPLRAAPWPSLMDSASILIENAVAVDDLHLYDVSANPPESICDF